MSYIIKEHEIVDVFFGTDALYLEPIVANMSLTLVWKTASYSIFIEPLKLKLTLEESPSHIFLCR